MLKASYLILEINEFGSYEAKTEENERVHIEDCEGWWLSGCCGSVAEHWRLSQRCSGFHSRQLPAFSLSSIFAS